MNGDQAVCGVHLNLDRTGWNVLNEQIDAARAADVALLNLAHMYSRRPAKRASPCHFVSACRKCGLNSPPPTAECALTYATRYPPPSTPLTCVMVTPSSCRVRLAIRASPCHLLSAWHACGLNSSPPTAEWAYTHAARYSPPSTPLTRVMVGVRNFGRSCSFPVPIAFLACQQV